MLRGSGGLLRRVVQGAPLSRVALAGVCHYDVLDVPDNASEKEIRKAYLLLSKRCHPDAHAKHGKAAQEKASKRFVAVNEAFEVLSDPLKRNDYDAQKAQARFMGGVDGGGNPWPGAGAATATYRPPSYHYRAPEDERFYGESPHRVGSNTTVVFGILAWTLLGLLYHYVAISKSKTELEEFLEARSAAAAQNHAEARQRAKENGYKKQLEILRQRVLGTD